MSDNDVKNDGVSPSARERFRSTLKERAEAITCVRNDIYTVKYVQLALNFVLGAGALAALIVSMVTDNAVARVVCLLAGLALFAALIVYNLILRAKAPVSYLQYTAVAKDKRYCFQVISKTCSKYSDGERTVTVDNMEFFDDRELLGPQYRFDFFADLDPDMRIGKTDKEIFVGTLEVNGERVKSKMVFKNGAPYYGVIGGTRIKYFDINSTVEKFVVPRALRDAAAHFDIPWPKLSGVYISDPYGNSKYKMEK